MLSGGGGVWPHLQRRRRHFRLPEILLSAGLGLVWGSPGQDTQAACWVGSGWVGAPWHGADLRWGAPLVH